MLALLVYYGDESTQGRYTPKSEVTYKELWYQPRLERKHQIHEEELIALMLEWLVLNFFGVGVLSRKWSG